MSLVVFHMFLLVCVQIWDFTQLFEFCFYYFNYPVLRHFFNVSVPDYTYWFILWQESQLFYLFFIKQLIISPKSFVNDTNPILKLLN